MSASPILVPSSLLTVPNTNPIVGQSAPENRFLIFGSQWLTLQTYITQGLKLPINMGEFKDKYGDFAKQATIQGCLDAMKSVNDLSGTFGNPTIIKGQLGSNPDYLTTTAPPKEIYGHIVWLANQIQNAANTFSFTFSSLQMLLASGTEKERAANLKMILVGKGGLASTADDMKVKTQALITKMATFDGQFSDANSKILVYSGASSEIMKDATQIIGSLDDDLKTNKEAADAAYQQWKDFTISAVTTSVGLMILTFGMAWPIAIGLGVGLGVAAAKAKETYNDFMEKMKKAEEAKAKKVRLKTDLLGLNSNVAVVSPAMAEFKQNLDTILGVWTDISMNLAYIANNYTDTQLADLTWLMQTAKILDAQGKWQNISTTTQQFTQHSLVSYDLSTDFGQKIAA